MTYCKLGSEFFDDCADAGLSDAAVRTHTEAITWLYRIERFDMRIGKHLVRRFAGSDQIDTAVKDLVAAEFWRDDGDAWVIEHHRNVVVQSLTAQVKHRDRERARQRRKRAKPSADVGTDVESNVGTNTDSNVAATQTDSLSVYTATTADLEDPLLPAPKASEEFCPKCEWKLDGSMHKRICGGVA